MPRNVATEKVCFDASLLSLRPLFLIESALFMLTMIFSCADSQDWTFECTICWIFSLIILMIMCEGEKVQRTESFRYNLIENKVWYTYVIDQKMSYVTKACHLDISIPHTNKPSWQLTLYSQSDAKIIRNTQAKLFMKIRFIGTKPPTPRQTFKSQPSTEPPEFESLCSAFRRILHSSNWLGRWVTRSEKLISTACVRMTLNSAIQMPTHLTSSHQPFNLDIVDWHVFPPRLSYFHLVQHHQNICFDCRNRDLISTCSQIVLFHICISNYF